VIGFDRNPHVIARTAGIEGGKLVILTSRTYSGFIRKRLTIPS
jgi:hypothetical protein